MAAGISFSIDFQNERYEAVKDATREDGRVRTKTGRSVKPAHIKQYVERVINDAIEKHEPEDPLADVDTEKIEDLSTEQKKALREELAQ